MHKARRAKLDRARKVREAEDERVDEDEGENEHTLERRRGRRDRTRMEEDGNGDVVEQERCGTSRREYTSDER